ncbi:MAG: hypothetical protein ACLUDM_09765 [[Eubacterium] siraeum]
MFQVLSTLLCPSLLAISCMFMPSLTSNVVAQEQKVKYDEELKNLQSRQAKRLDKASVKNETNGTATKAHKRLARTISKITGYTVTLVDSTNGYNNKQNGRTAIGSINSTKGEIVLDIGEGNVAATSLHESVHYIRINAPEEFNAMSKYVVEWLTRNGTLEEYLDRYASSYKLDNIYDLTEEMTADVAEALLKNADFVEDLFTDEAFVKEICGENRTFAEKFVDALKSIIEAIKNYLKSGDVNHLIAGKLSEDAKALEEFKNLWENALKAAVNNHAEISNAKENTDTESRGGKYSLKEDAEGKLYVEVKTDDNIAKNISAHDAVKVLSNIVKTKFSSFIDVHGQNIAVNSKTAREWAFSKSAKILLKSSPQIYSDKINSFNNADELLRAAKQYVGEASVHGNFSEFARGIVRFKVGNNGYQTDIIVGITTNQIAVLYDIVNITNIKITEAPNTNLKVKDTLVRSNGTSVENSISQTPETVKGNSNKFSLSETDSNGNKLSKTPVINSIDEIMSKLEGNGYFAFRGASEHDIEVADRGYLDRSLDLWDSRGISYDDEAELLNGTSGIGINSYMDKSEILKRFEMAKGYAKNHHGTNVVLLISDTTEDYEGADENEVILGHGGYGADVIAVVNIDSEETGTKFSLSEPVEEKGNLIAVHNIYTDKLVKSLKLGGFPMPSIAVIKSDMGHGNYGECSFVFDKSTIDPKADKRNKVYGGDAWTPTYPSIDYKVNENVADKARKKYYYLYEQYGEKVRDMYRYGVTLEDTLNSDGGEQKMLNKLYDDTAMMQVYRLDHGDNVISNVVKKEEKQTLNEQEIVLSKQLLSTLGNKIEEIAVKNGENPLPIRKAFFNKYHDEVIEAFKKYYRSTGMSIEEAETKVANTKMFTFVSSLAKALKYKHNKGIIVTEDIDYEATDKAIRDSVDQSEYRGWIDSLFKGAEEKRGIWNGKDFYTPSGKMRNFDALHYEENLENVVKAMRSDMNGDTLFGGMGIWGVAQKEYSSIDKLKSDSARLQKMSDDEYSNIKSGFAEQLSEVTKAIKNDYSGNDFIDSDIVAGNIEVLKKCFEYYANHIQNGTNAVRDMSHKEMEALYKVLKALRYAVKTADKAFSANIKQRITELAENSIAEMATDKTRNPFNKNKGAEAVGALDTYLNSQMLDARSYHRGLGDSAMEIYKAFRAGLNTYISHIHEIQDYFAKVRKESGLSEKQFKMLSEKYETYETSHGKITMSKAQLMSLYCLSKREQALEHIFGGGIRPTDLKGVRQARPIRISPDELTSLLKNLNSTEIATAEKLQKFMATACAKWGNEVSMAMYGYAKFGDPHYFPIKSSQTGVDTNDQNSGGETGLYSMLNYGFTKSLVPNANNAIDIDDIFNVVSQHAQEMSSYSAYAGAVADGMRWLNYNNRKTGETIKQSMLQKFGTNCEKYFTELIRDINRNKPTGNYGGELSSLLVSAQKAAAIAGNLSVVIQQPTAIMRACAVLDIDLIAKGIAIAATHSVKSAKEAQAHSEIAWWKSQGFFETNMGKSMDEIITGRSTAKDKVVGLAMKPAGFFDDLTWGAIWEATKLWTKKFHPEAEVGSDEFFSITKEKFDDVVDQTQVVDSVLHRPMILRSKNALVKMDMSFMAEPLKSANLLRNAIVDVKNKKPNATKRLIRVYASCVMATVLAAAAKAIVMAFRDTGDDEWREKWLESFVGDLLSSLNPVSIIPFVKDILTLLDGYDVERMDMSAISGIIKFGQQMVTSAQKGELDTSLSLQNVYKLTRYLSQLTGIPVYNVLREVDTIVDIFGEPIFRASQATPDTERYEALYNAVMKNDEAETQNEYDRLGKTQKEIEQRLKSKIIDDSKGNKMFNADVDKAAKARISGDVKTAVEIVRNLADTTALSKDFWTACVNARVNKISKAQENRTQLIEAGISKLTVDNMSDTEVNEALKSYETEADTSTASDLNEDTNTESLYKADDLVKALQDGNESDYNTAYDDMVSAKAVSLIMQAEADNKELTADEAEEKAESSIKSAITKVLKPLMRELYKTDKKKFNEMRKKIIKKFGYTSKQITKWLTSEE